MNFKKIILIILVCAIVIGLAYALSRTGKKTVDNGKMHLVASNFASYDFLRAIIGNSEKFDVDFLLGPGKDSHSYDPTARDLIKIQNADLFVYVGGGIEKWADKVLKAIDEPSKIICVSDYVDKETEEEIDGAEEEEEEEEEEGAFNEHIWTSPSNAIKMVEILREKVIELDPENKDTYLANAENYINQIKGVDSKIQEIVDNKVRDRLVFGDKMPMQYFINYYKLKVSAAFAGCSTETEPSAATIAYLERLVKEENIPVVLYIELNNGRVANTIADEAGENCQALRIQTLHNISLDDFEAGETWVSLMTRNLEVLKKALQ